MRDIKIKCHLKADGSSTRIRNERLHRSVCTVCLHTNIYTGCILLRTGPTEDDGGRRTDGQFYDRFRGSVWLVCAANRISCAPVLCVDSTTFTHHSDTLCPTNGNERNRNERMEKVNKRIEHYISRMCMLSFGYITR